MKRILYFAMYVIAWMIILYLGYACSIWIWLTLTGDPKANERFVVTVLLTGIMMLWSFIPEINEVLGEKGISQFQTMFWIWLGLSVTLAALTRYIAKALLNKGHIYKFRRWFP